MKAYKGIFDGEKVTFLEKPPTGKKYVIAVTFLEEIEEDDQLRDFTEQSDALSFWEDPREDVYQDYVDK